MRADFYVDADDRLTELAQSVEASVTQPQALLVFASGPETSVTLVAGRIIRSLVLLAGMNFGMDFQHAHYNSPERDGQVECQKLSLAETERTRLMSSKFSTLREFAHDSAE
jgi:hypothetical protein